MFVCGPQCQPNASQVWLMQAVAYTDAFPDGVPNDPEGGGDDGGDGYRPVVFYEFDDASLARNLLVVPDTATLENLKSQATQMAAGLKGCISRWGALHVSDRLPSHAGVLVTPWSVRSIIRECDDHEAGVSVAARRRFGSSPGLRARWAVDDERITLETTMADRRRAFDLIFPGLRQAPNSSCDDAHQLMPSTIAELVEWTREHAESDAESDDATEADDCDTAALLQLAT